MIHCMSNFFHKNQGGFTLLEVAVSLAITSFIALGVAVSSAQVLTQTSKNSDFTTASRNAMNAIFWIGRDGQMAQSFAGAAGFPATADLSMAWEDWESVSHNITYSIEDGKLYRTHTIDSESTVSLVAEYINDDSELTYCSSDNGTLSLTITSSVGGGANIVDVTRVRQITARPQM
jgi:prepilin-type N-terminal cleavage/methylation domain-containing protein